MEPVDHDKWEIIMFMARYWQYFMTGLASLLGVTIVMRKGKRDSPTIVALSEKHINNKLKICAGDLKDEVRAEFKQDLNVLKTDLLREFELMVRAIK